MHDDAYSASNLHSRGRGFFGCSVTRSNRLLLGVFVVFFLIPCVVEACSTSTCLLGSAQPAILRSSRQEDVAFQHDGEVLLDASPALTSAKAMAQCRSVHLVKDQCEFIQANCDQEAGLISYLQFYYCTLPNAKPLAFAVLCLWLVVLFSTIGITSSDYFSVSFVAWAAFSTYIVE